MVIATPLMVNLPDVRGMFNPELEAVVYMLRGGVVRREAFETPDVPRR
jgi:hypothetical protein